MPGRSKACTARHLSAGTPHTTTLPARILPPQLPGRIPDTFPDARSWAACLLPLLAEETRAGLQQELERLGSLQWLPLEAPPRLAFGNVPVELERSSTCFAEITLEKDIGAGASGWGKPAWGHSTMASGGRRAPKPPVLLKPTDFVLLTNSKVREES